MGANFRNVPLVILGYTFPVTRLFAVVHFIVMLYALAFWIQIGVNPWLTKKLGVDTTMYGYLETTFAVLQLCGMLRWRHCPIEAGNIFIWLIVYGYGQQEIINLKTQKESE